MLVKKKKKKQEMMALCSKKLKELIAVFRLHLQLIINLFQLFGLHTVSYFTYVSALPISSLSSSSATLSRFQSIWVVQKSQGILATAVFLQEYDSIPLL